MMLAVVPSSMVSCCHLKSMRATDKGKNTMPITILYVTPTGKSETPVNYLDTPTSWKLRSPCTSVNDTTDATWLHLRSTHSVCLIICPAYHGQKHQVELYRHIQLITYQDRRRERAVLSAQPTTVPAGGYERDVSLCRPAMFPD